MLKSASRAGHHAVLLVQGPLSGACDARPSRGRVSDGRWSDIEADTAAAVDHFSRAIQIYRGPGLQDDSMDGYVRRMAFMHAMLAGHTSLESTLLRILQIQGEEAPSGGQWHADLIQRAGRATGNRPAILPAVLARATDRTRKFRHVAIRRGTTHSIRTTPNPRCGQQKKWRRDLPPPLRPIDRLWTRPPIRPTASPACAASHARSRVSLNEQQRQRAQEASVAAWRAPRPEPARPRRALASGLRAR